MNMASEERRKNFKNKNTFQEEQVRSRRQQHTVEIRKQKREENLAKRRTKATVTRDMSDSDDELDQNANNNEVHLA